MAITQTKMRYGKTYHYENEIPAGWEAWENAIPQSDEFHEFRFYEINGEDDNFRYIYTAKPIIEGGK